MSQSGSERKAPPDGMGRGVSRGGGASQGMLKGKLGRVADEARGLIDDTREWVDLKLQLFEMDVEERLERTVNAVAARALVAFLGGMAALFVLVALAFGLGDWWDNTPLGFLAVAGIMAALGAAVHYLRPRFVQGPIRIREIGLPPGGEAKQLPEGKTEEHHA